MITNEMLKVLVVDDDQRMVRTIRDILRVKGYEAATAGSGEEALEKVRAETPDCVLMDLKMPGIDGVETLKLLKEIAPDLPVVLMSAYATDEAVNEAKRHGAHGVLTKPVDVQQVLSFLSILRKEESILVVDDDPAFCKTLTDVLQARGYRVESEGDSEKVAAKLEREYKLTVILDIKLGSANGLDVLKDIRSKYPTKPVILVTGYGDAMAESLRMGRQIGAYTSLYKPLEVDGLIRLIEEISKGKLRAALGEPFPEAIREEQEVQA